jgi:DNA polymerase III alpha subunit
MDELLRETYGVMVYQEDVIKVVHRLGGMPLGEADLFRRAMSGKMRSKEAMADLKDRFIRACGNRGVPQPVAREIWRQIASFAGYSFCKVHSASYAQISLQVAFLKTHYPAEFMAAVLSNQGGFYHASAYVEEARRMGLAILPPDINRSLFGFPAEIAEGVKPGPTVLGAAAGRRNAVRVGLVQVKGLSRPELLWNLEILHSTARFTCSGTS